MTKGKYYSVLRVLTTAVFLHYASPAPILRTFNVLFSIFPPVLLNACPRALSADLLLLKAFITITRGNKAVFILRNFLFLVISSRIEYRFLFSWYNKLDFNQRSTN